MLARLALTSARAARCSIARCRLLGLVAARAAHTARRAQQHGFGAVRATQLGIKPWGLVALVMPTILGA